ncbi:MAG: methyltransferase [Verrucomicrobia bacterium]|nr:methyltransferase [Verrucomicrobiota bacterium]
MKPTPRLIFAVVMFCFFVSGMAGLVYQIVWTRYLALFLGHTSYAVVAVLVAFMGGLALGNAWFGMRADRATKPLAVYGWLEIGIGIYALVFPVYYRLCHEGFIGLARQLHLESGTNGLLVLKFGFSFLTILLPTFMMGATFPVLTKFVTRSLSELRERVAALYCINSVGAVAGCLVGDFWWIPSIGLEMTVYGGAILNIAVGIVALMLSKRIREGKDSLPAIEPIAKPGEERFTAAELRLAIIGIGLSGFVAMLYEVAWTRLLGLALGSSTHAFSIMLITFITGIAVGAWIIYLWKNLRRTLEAFAWAEIALAGTLFASMFFYEYLPYWFAKLAALLNRQPDAYPLYQFFKAIICFSVMFIPTVCLGMTLPLVSRIATEELARTGRSVGKVFAVNTLGTVLGAIVTGLWLMPAFGLAWTFAIGIVVNALIGFALLQRHQLARHWLLLLPVGIGLLVLTGLMFGESWKRTLSLGLWRSPVPPPSMEAYRQMAQADTLKFHRDGAGSTVVVIEQKHGDKKHLGLKVNGKADASTSIDMTTQLLSGHIPMLLRPQSQQVLVVGLGSGMTCSAVARHPSVQRVDAVEISSEVAEAAKLFGAYNDNFWTNPRVKLVIEDAKSFLKITDQQYDVIVSEPSNPWMAGVSGVFSREYYESCQARLKPDGLMAQWVQIYETSDQTLNMVLTTFGSVFPFFSVWHPASSDLVLIGSTRPFKADLAALEQRFQEPSVKSDLQRIEITRLPVLLAREIVSQQNGSFMAPAQGTIHSDFYPVLEFLAQEAFFVGRATAGWRTFDESFLTRPMTLLGDYLQKHQLTEADYKALGSFYMEYRLPKPDIFRSLLLRWQQEKPEATLPIELMAEASDQILTAELEALRLAPRQDMLMKHAEKDPEPLRMYASYLIQTYRSQRSVFYRPPSEELEKVLQRLLETNPANRRVYQLHLAELAWDRGDDQACFEFGQKGLDPDIERGGRISFSIDHRAPRYVLYRMIESFWRTGKLLDAARLCQDATQGRYTGTYPLLDMTCRKIEGYVTSLRTEPVQ